MFALVDCNNFYASCERVFRPDLNNKAIVVLSNNDGCVIARSNEAKQFGVPMGMPAFKLHSEFKKYPINIFSANFPLYGDMSNRVMNLLRDYTPEIEVYSIDESFLKFTGFERYDLNEYGRKIQQRVLKYTGIPISVGIAPTKSLAKIANKIAKKYPLRTAGSYVIDTIEKREKALKWTSIEEVWGVGYKTAKRLRNRGVNTAYDFVLMNDTWVRQQLSVVGLRLKRDLSGIPTLDLEQLKDRKNIAVTRSFESNYTKIEDLTERISTFAVICAEKMRKQNSLCNALMVFIRSNYFRKDLPQYHRSFVIQLPYPTSSSLELVGFAQKALQKIYRPDIQYKKAGVIALNLIPKDQIQLNLFQNSNPKHIPLMQAIDKINNLFGQQKVKLAIQDLTRTWKMKQEYLSPRYTTHIKEILVVKG